MRVTLSLLSVFVLSLSAFAGEKQKDMGAWKGDVYENAAYKLALHMPQGMERLSENDLNQLNQEKPKEKTIYVALRGVSKEVEGTIVVVQGIYANEVIGYSLESGKRYLEDLKVNGTTLPGKVSLTEYGLELYRGDYQVNNRLLAIFAFFRKDSLFAIQVQGASTEVVNTAAKRVAEGLRFQPEWERREKSLPQGVEQKSAPLFLPGITAGKIKKKVVPIYPGDARRAGISGSVVLRGIIRKDGVVDSIAIVEGHSMLWEAALNAVKEWTYEPYLLDGIPVNVETKITVNFNLSR